MADNDGDVDEARKLRPLQAAACTYRIAFGPRAGQKVLTVQGVMPRDADFKQHLCADMDGFSLHAAVRCGADDRQALEQLCRYITRPALANERVQTNAAGQVVLKLKSAWRDGPPLREPWGVGAQRHTARPGSAATARAASPGHTARRVRGSPRAPPRGAAELGQAAQARLIDSALKH
jgi:hypothetical protein